jgi:hypothetical protein
VSRFDVRSVAVLALGAVALTTASPAVASNCSNSVFENAAIAALGQRNKAIGQAYLENYTSAKADAYIGWRTVIEAPEPCDSRLRNVRRHLLRHLGALWLSYAARAAGDIDYGLAFLVAASREAALTNAAVASATSLVSDAGPPGSRTAPNA